MNIKKWLAVPGVIIGSLGLLAGPASLAASASPAIPSDVPSCVTYTDSDFTTGLTNNCGSTQNVQVIISWGPDSGCTALAPGETYLYHYWPGVFDHIQSC